MQSLWISGLYPDGFSTLSGNPLSFPASQYYVQRGGQLLDSIESVVYGAFNIDNSTVDFIQATPGLPRVTLLRPGHPAMHLDSLAQAQAWRHERMPSDEACTCSAGGRGDAIGPGCAAPMFDENRVCDTAGWLHGIDQLSAQVNLRSFNPQRVLVTSAACTDWTMQVEWDLGSPGTARVSIDPRSRACHDFALTRAPASYLAVALIVFVALYQLMLCGSGLRQWGVVRDLLIVQRLAGLLPRTTLTAVQQHIQATKAAEKHAFGSPSASSTNLHHLVLAARQLDAFPMCSERKQLGGLTATRFSAQPSACYGAVLCCTSREHYTARRTCSCLSYVLWPCGPGAWWATRCLRAAACSTSPSSSFSRRTLVSTFFVLALIFACA